MVCVPWHYADGRPLEDLASPRGSFKFSGRGSRASAAASFHWLILVCFVYIFPCWHQGDPVTLGNDTILKGSEGDRAPSFFSYQQKQMAAFFALNLSEHPIAPRVASRLPGQLLPAALRLRPQSPQWLLPAAPQASRAPLRAPASERRRKKTPTGWPARRLGRFFSELLRFCGLKKKVKDKYGAGFAELLRVKRETKRKSRHFRESYECGCQE